MIPPTTFMLSTENAEEPEVDLPGHGEEEQGEEGDRAARRATARWPAGPCGRSSR